MQREKHIVEPLMLQPSNYNGAQLTTPYSTLSTASYAQVRNQNQVRIFEFFKNFKILIFEMKQLVLN